MAGIHVHPHDIIDESSDSILKMIDKIPSISQIFVQVNTIFERNPNPTGVLPRNPKREVVFGDGKLYLSGFQQNKQIKIEVADEILAGKNPFSDFYNHVPKEKYAVVPWVNVLNGSFTSENSMITYRGIKIDNWICPNSPDIYNLWIYLLKYMNKRYGINEFMLDRIRYPDWSGEEVNPEMIFTCFCSKCESLMVNNGIDVDELKKVMDAICTLLLNKEFFKAVDILKNNNLIRNWIYFRQNGITQLLKRLTSQLPHFNFWIDLWPPSYSWLLGQDYSQLTEEVKRIKHFPYHKLGGGADVQGLIDHFAGEDTYNQNECFQAFLKCFDLPYEIGYEDFKQHGFPIKFVYDENKKVRNLSKKGTIINSGIQMWNIPVDEFLKTLDIVNSSEADDVIYYCYGWAEDIYFNELSKF